jgi:hypothetical protein
LICDKKCPIGALPLNSLLPFAAKLAGRDEIYFVNADGKHTVSRILNSYRRAGVPSAGIVDFDALNSAGLLTELMIAANVPEGDRVRALEIRDKIAQRAGEQLAIDRIRALQPAIESILGDVIVGIRSGERNTGCSDTEIEKKLAEIRCHLQAAAEGTKPWRELKRDGRSALGSSLEAEFDELYGLLSRHGMFINPAGELESMLRDVGIEATTDKRAWILRALQLIRSLQIEADKFPWRFMNDVLEYFTKSAQPKESVALGGTSTETFAPAFSEPHRCP